MTNANTHPDGGQGQHPSGITRKWWFWTIVGAVVAGTTIGIVVGTLPDEQPDGSLGSVQMPIR